MQATSAAAITRGGESTTRGDGSGGCTIMDNGSGGNTIRAEGATAMAAT
jgi:hypothetical protein